MNLKHIRQLIFGQDIFISHRWTESSKNYALQLAKSLENRGLDCFVDYNEIRGGDSIPAVIQLAIKRSRLFILIAHKDVLDSTSNWIPQEIKLANNGVRKIVPLNIANMIEDFDLTAPEWEVLKGRKCIEETLEAYEAVAPSPDVLREIDETFTARRNKAKATQYLFILAVIVFILTFGSAGFAVYIQRQAQTETNKLREEAKQARTEIEIAKEEKEKAVSEKIKAQEEREFALADRDRFSKEKEVAEKDRDIAKSDVIKQTKLAESKTLEANKQKAKADEQQKIAQENIEDSKTQQQIAAEKNNEANLLLYAANMRTADNFYKNYNIDSFRQTLDNINPEYRGIEWEYLNRLTNGTVEFQSLPNEPISKMTFSPDGRYLLVLFQNKKSTRLLKLDLQTGLSESLGNVNDSIKDFAISPNKKWLTYCSNSIGNKLFVWDISGDIWEKYVIPTDLNEKFDFVAFTPNSEEIITINSNEENIIENRITIKRWNINIKTQIGQPITKTFKSSIEIWEVSSAGSIFIRSYQSKHGFILLDSSLNEIPFLTEEGEFDLIDYKFSMNGNQIAFETMHEYEFKVFIFNLVDKKTIELPSEIRFSENLGGRGRGMGFSDDGELLAISFENGVGVVGLKENKIIKEMPLELGEFLRHLSFSPDNSFLAINSNYNEGVFFKVSRYSLWSVKPSENHLVIHSLNSKGSEFSFNDMEPILNCKYECESIVAKGGAKLLTEEKLGKWILWDTFNEAEIAVLTPHPVNENQKRYINFSPDGTYLYSYFYESDIYVENDHDLQLWDTLTGKEILLESEKECKCDSNPTFTKDRNEMAIICDNGNIVVWNLKSGEKIKNIPTGIKGDNLLLSLYEKDRLLILEDLNNEQTYSYDFVTGTQLYLEQTLIPFFSGMIAESSDGKWLVYKNTKSDYFLLNESDENFKPIYLVGDVGRDSDRFHFSSDSKFLLVDSIGNDYIKNLTTMENVKLEEGDKLLFPIFSPLGSFVIQFDDSGFTYWNAKTGKKGKLIQQCSNNPTFTLDEKRLVTSCSDGNVKFTDLRSGQEVLSIETHMSEINKITLSPDEKYMLIISVKDGAKLWRLKQ